MIKKATKKPIEIEYITYEDFTELIIIDNITEKIGNTKEILFNASNPIIELLEYDNENDYGEEIQKELILAYNIKTLEGTHDFTPQDVLIIGIKGEIYPCKKDIFKLTYNT